MAESAPWFFAWFGSFASLVCLFWFGFCLRLVCPPFGSWGFALFAFFCFVFALALLAVPFWLFLPTWVPRPLRCCLPLGCLPAALCLLLASRVACRLFAWPFWWVCPGSGCFSVRVLCVLLAVCACVSRRSPVLAFVLLLRWGCCCCPAPLLPSNTDTVHVACGAWSCRWTLLIFLQNGASQCLIHIGVLL